jgi:hypothetical protein
MDKGLLSTPNKRSFLRFTGTGLWTPDGSVHGFDLGNILAINSNYNVETERVPYAFNGQNVTALEEAIMVSPDWTIRGNQFHTRIRQLLMMGTKQADVVQAAATGATQTLTGVVVGASYDLGVRGASNLAATVSAASKAAGVDYEFDTVTGIFRVLEGGTIAAGANVVLTYDVPALTREEYTAFDNQNQQGTIRIFGLRLGDGTPGEEAILAGNLYTENTGDLDPKKHREWSMKLSVSGSPRFRMAKS